MNPVERVLRGIDRWQQRHKPAALTFGVVKKYGDDNAGQLAASLTHTGFLTLFPLLLVLTTVLGLVAASHPALRHSVDHAVQGQFPAIGKQLTGNVGALKRSSLIGLIVGLLLAISELASLSAFGQHNVGIIVAADALAAVVNIGMFLFAFRVLTPKGVPSRDLAPGAIIAGGLWTVLQGARHPGGAENAASAQY